MTLPLRAAFDITSDTAVIAAPAAGNYIHVVGIGMHNNETAAANNLVVRLKDGSGGTNLYGGATGAIYLPGNSGTWDLPMSYAYPYWDLTAATGLYITPASAYRVSGAVWYFTDTTASYNPLHATFDITASTSVISATADQKIYIVGISLHNQSTVGAELVFLYDGDPASAGTSIYGGTTGAARIIDTGGHFRTPMSYDNPWFECSTNTAFYIKPNGGYRVSGTVWYYKA